MKLILSFSAALLFVVCVVAPTLSKADDDCEDAGKLGVMLGQIDNQCAKYELTAAGRHVMVKMAEKVLPLGGEQCAEKGKVAMLQQMSELNPHLDTIAASANQKALNAALCNAIANYLALLGDPKTVRLRK